MKWKVAEPVDGGIPAVYPDTGKMEFPIAVKPDIIRADVWAEHARLIAAAPDLYAALLAQEEADDARSNCVECEGQGDWTHCAECSPRFGNAICLRRAALAKASPSARMLVEGGE